MDTVLPLCALCEISTIYRFTEDHCEINGKKICMNCISKLTTSVVPVLNKPPVIETSIPENATIALGQWEKCPIHNHKSRLICATCSVSCCVLCVPVHDSHKFQSIEDVIVETAPIFYEIDYLAKLSEKDLKNNADALKGLQESLCKFFGKIQNKPPFETLKKCQCKAEKYSKKLKELVISFAGKRLADVVKSIKSPGQETKRLDKFIHWIQWNSSRFLLNNIEDFSEKELTLPEGFKFPHFCRSIFISPTEILACGGRTEPSSNGLRKAFVFSTNTGTAKHIPDMNSGRANHCLLHFAGFIYAIGGCDHDNKYTNRVERLHIDALQWEALSSTNEIRDSTSGVGVEIENAIYVFGGRYANSLISSTVEKYLVSCNKWISLSIKLTYETMVLGTVKISPSKVLIFAGQDGSANPLKKCNIVDVLTGKVVEIADFENGGCIVNEPVFYNGKVITYVFEGSSTRSIHTWSAETECWDHKNIN